MRLPEDNSCPEINANTNNRCSSLTKDFIYFYLYVQVFCQYYCAQYFQRPEEGIGTLGTGVPEVMSYRVNATTKPRSSVRSLSALKPQSHLSSSINNRFLIIQGNSGMEMKYSTKFL